MGSQGGGETETEVWICRSKGADLEKGTVRLPPLGVTEVEIRMTHSGLCHTDIHMQNNDWGTSDYPIVLGHEGVGVVTAVGDRIATHKEGDVVGVGWMRDSCGTCLRCLQGRENMCAKGYQGTYLGESAGMWGSKKHNEHGCFSRLMRVEARFALHVPESIPPEVAAPLLCAGMTVWEPIVDYVKPGSKVGVRALGGLGHMAVQLAKAIGAEVTAISHSAKKEERIRKLGAKHYVVSEDKESMQRAEASLDLIVDTCPVADDVEDLEPWLSLLAFGGTYCKVGIPNAEFKYKFIPMIFTHRKIAGSVVSGSVNAQSLFQVAATHKVDCDVEVVPYDKINQVMKDLKSGKGDNFRYVLKW